MIFVHHYVQWTFFNQLSYHFTYFLRCLVYFWRTWKMLFCFANHNGMTALVCDKIGRKHYQSARIQTNQSFKAWCQQINSGFSTKDLPPPPPICSVADIEIFWLYLHVLPQFQNISFVHFWFLTKLFTIVCWYTYIATTYSYLSGVRTSQKSCKVGIFKRVF